ncbi:sensor histidine kinase [Glycomyces algeriensis]|uniref:histidine kinase n=1 Tax=Glycomyces algeriensis TaxID=256037 RepID=A0A9W6GBG5_9ACTN|nr:sensor histidine kinase [Glycomyces algeriensis]MDA1367284.1 sensor histidine kinase [Glycomyces algeriensis]MDR7351064.1 signal transduction histidine kinase [Glycomyces algeriensis]GLI43777.1 two-component sensor histidine kinase [Glycomyces algeriensis]
MHAASTFTRLKRRIRERPLLADTLLAIVSAAGYLGFYGVSAALTPDLTLTWAQAGLMAVPFAAISLRRAWLWGGIVLSLLVMGVAFFVAPLEGMVMDSGVGMFVLTYTAAAYLPLPRALVAAAAIWVPVVLFVQSAAFRGGDHLTSSLITMLNIALASTVFWIGWVIRNRREKVVELSERARFAEERQEALAAQAVADEQRRIARELHDVVAHHISVIGVMSEGAKRVLRHDPEAAEDALTTVNQTARTALREMRDILTVLRQGRDEGGSADLEPQPTVDSLRALVAQTKDAGLPVRYTVRGEEYPLPTGVSLAVYRIAQEALTNTIKHAGPQARAGVVVDYGDAEFRISVGDSGHGAPVVSGFSGGHGLIGMRERATLYGGSLEAGPRPGGGYLVEARFPKNAHLQGVIR